VWWIYILAHATAAILACSVFAFVSGVGPLNPHTSRREMDLSWPEAVAMWLTGSPPRRLRSRGENENVTGLLHDLRAMRKKIAEVGSRSEDAK